MARCSGAARAFCFDLALGLKRGLLAPFDYVGENYEQALNPSPYSLLAQRIGEERHSLRRREGLRRAQTHCQNCLRQFRRTRAAVLVRTGFRRIMLV